MNKDRNFNQILQTTQIAQNGSQKRIKSSSQLVSQNQNSETNKQLNGINISSSSMSFQNLKSSQLRPFTAKPISHSSFSKLPSSKQDIEMHTNEQQIQKLNPFHRNRHVSSPHGNSSVKMIQKTQKTTTQMQSTQTGLTFKSLETIPQSCYNLSSSQYYEMTNNSLKTFSPDKSKGQYPKSHQQQQQQQQSLISYDRSYKYQDKEMVQGNTEISDSYYMHERKINDMSFQVQEALNSLKVEQVIKLYESKCEDIKLEVQFPQLLKFVDRIQNSCVLGKLDLSEQALGPQSAKIIADIIVQNQTFSSLNLYRNNIKDEGALEIAQAIMNNPNICIVNVANNNLSPQGCSYFFELLEYNQTIYSLNISSPQSYNRNKMNTETAKKITSMLISNQTLSFLDISHAQLGPQGLHKIVKGLKENKGLISLNISYNDLGTDCGMLLTPTLLNSKLIELNLSNNKIGNISLERIGEVVRSGQGVFSIENIDFSFNQITSEGFCSFMNMIMRNNKIIKLNFDGNSFQDPLNDSLTNFFIANTSLRHFSVKDCSFHSSFVENIALEISHNYIGDEGVRHLSECLCKENKYLEELYMKRCNIQEKGGAEIAKVLVSHPRLYKIDVSHNLMGENSGTFISANIRVNWNIIFFDIDKNYIRYDQHVEIKKLVKRNQEFQKIKEPVKLLNTLGSLKSSEIKKEDLDKRKNDILYKSHLNKQEGQLLEINIQQAEQILTKTEQIIKEQNQEIRNEMDIIMKELKEQDIKQNTLIKDLQSDLDKQFEANQNVKKQIESMKKEIKYKTQDMIQRKNLLKGQVAFQKRVVKDEELKAKSEEMAFQMFQQNVENLRKKIEVLKQERPLEQTLGISRTMSTTPNSPQASKSTNFSFPSNQKNNDGFPNKISNFKNNKQKAASSTNLKTTKKKPKK